MGQKLLTLTGDQEKVLAALIEWLKDPDPEYRWVKITGPAGTGKTTMLNEALRVASEEEDTYLNDMAQNFRTRELADKYAAKIHISGSRVRVVRQLDSQGLPWRASRTTPLVGAVAPTVKAVNVLEDRNKGFFDEVKTLHSFLRLVSKDERWTSKDDRHLGSLAAIPEDERTELEAEELEYQLFRKKICLSDEPFFVPMDSSFQHLWQYGLMILDEGSMLKEQEFRTVMGIFKGISDLEMHPWLRGICMADYAQHPPIDEKISRTSELFSLGHLEQVVRNKGNVLKLCTDIRTSPDWQNCYARFADCGRGVYVLPETECLQRTAEMIRKGKEVCIGATTNKRVIDLNRLIIYLLKGEGNFDYDPGDVIMSRGRVTRNEDDLPGSKRDKNILGTRIRVRIDDILRKETKVNPLTGNRFDVFEAACTRVGSDFQMEQTLYLMRPDQLNQWIEDKKMAWNRASQFLSRTSARGKSGTEARKLWLEIHHPHDPELVMHSWNFWGRKTRRILADDLPQVKKDPNRPVTSEDYAIIREGIFAQWDAVNQMADDFLYAHSVTSYSLQGDTVANMVLDGQSVFPQLNPSSKFYGDNATWDPRAAAYVIASRTSKKCCISLPNHMFAY